jgi:hypothetical protein
MAKFKTEVSHQLGKDAAQKRLQSFIAKVSQQLQAQATQLQSDWEDNLLKFCITTFGMKIDGTLTVEEASAHVEGSLPLAALMFKGKIETTIQTELARALS